MTPVFITFSGDPDDGWCMDSCAGDEKSVKAVKWFLDIDGYDNWLANIGYEKPLTYLVVKAHYVYHEPSPEEAWGDSDVELDEVLYAGPLSGAK